VSALDFFAWDSNGNKNGATMGLATVGGECTVINNYNEITLSSHFQVCATMNTTALSLNSGALTNLENLILHLVLLQFTFLHMK
jgi:hypothetical protein